MARTAITITQDTAARLRAAMLDLSNDAGEVLTLDGAVNFLLDTWMSWRNVNEPTIAAHMTPEQYGALIEQLADRWAAQMSGVTLEEWKRTMLAAGGRYQHEQHTETEGPSDR